MRTLESASSALDEKSDSAPQLIEHHQSEINKIYQQALFKEVQTLLDRNAFPFRKGNFELLLSVRRRAVRPYSNNEIHIQSNCARSVQC